MISKEIEITLTPINEQTIRVKKVIRDNKVVVGLLERDKLRKWTVEQLLKHLDKLNL